MKVRVLKNITDWGGRLTTGVYECSFNQHGAVCAICKEFPGGYGLKPGEFEFLPEYEHEAEYAKRWPRHIKCSLEKFIQDREIPK